MGRAKELLLPLGHVVQIKPDLSPETWSELQERESHLRFQAPDGSFYLTDEELLEARELGLRFEVVRRVSEAELPVRFSLPHDGAVNDWPPEDARLAVLARLLAEDRANGSVHIRFLGAITRCRRRLRARLRRRPAARVAGDPRGGSRRAPALHDASAPARVARTRERASCSRSDPGG
jgi:hypothetical protein